MKLVLIIFMSIILIMACTSQAPRQRETLMQISTLDALLNGLYDGDMKLSELDQYGDFGIGTVQSLDGELLIVDGIPYQVRVDGSVQVPDPDMATPFSAVTFFDVDQEMPLPTGMIYETFRAKTDSVLPTCNFFYAIRIEGTFKHVRTRSVPPQTKPYPPLAEVVKNQAEFEFDDAEGIMVGFRCPSWVKGINAPGYHLHFLTKDKTGGGHVLDFEIQDAIIQIDNTSDFFMRLPNTSDFYQLSLDQDNGSAMQAVEKQK